MKKLIIALIILIIVATAIFSIIRIKNNSNNVQEIVKLEDVVEETQLPQQTEKKVEATEVVPSTTETPQIIKATVCIDAGHGITSRKEKESVYPNGSEKKATNVSGAAGEEEFNLELAMMVQKKFEANGITTVMTRTTHNCDLSNIERANIGNECDYVIRIHSDGSDDSSISGLSVLVPQKSYYNDNKFVEVSTRLANAVSTEALKQTGAISRGIVTRSDLTGFNWSRKPVILIECGFMSNPAEKAKLQTTEYKEKLADGIVNGFINFLQGI